MAIKFNTRCHASKKIRERLVKTRGDVDYLLTIAIDESTKDRIKYVYEKMMEDLHKPLWDEIMGMLLVGKSFEEIKKKTGAEKWKIEIVNKERSSTLRKEVIRLLDEGFTKEQVQEKFNIESRTISGIISTVTAYRSRKKKELLDSKARKVYHVLLPNMSSTQLMDAYIMKPFGYKWRMESRDID